MALTWVMHDAIRALRLDLTRAGFTVDALTDLWGPEADAALHRGNRVPAIRATEEVPALGTLARLFVLGLPVPEGDAAEALTSVGMEGAAGLGLISREGSTVHPLLDLRPYSFLDSIGVASWWIASDLGEVATGGPLREDHVLGVGGASVTLSTLMVPAPVLSALDLGTGCGIQAMHASRHARRVVATDISERALEIAAFNAALNGIDNIEFRRGSLFAPVAGERFDHIVSNPPFVITPRVKGVPAYEYRDGGMAGDDLVATVLQQAVEHLTDGGIAQLLGNWEYSTVDGLDRVRSWLDETGAGDGVDAWAIEREVQDAALYAETWIRDGGTRAGRRADELSGAWLDDFAARGVSSVGFGYITLRRAPRSTASALRRFEQLPGRLGHNPTGVGEHIAACLAAHDWLRDHPELGSARLLVAGDVTEQRHYWPGAEDPTVMTLEQGGGFGRSTPVDTALAGFVGACDGELTVGAITDALGQLLGVDAIALAGALHPKIRELVFTGMLRPA